LTVVAKVGHDDTIDLYEPLTLPGTHLHILEKGVAAKAYLNTLTNKAVDLNMDEKNWLRLAWQRVNEDYQRALKSAAVVETAFVSWGDL